MRAANFVFSSALLGLLLLAACAPAPTGQDLVGTSWVLTSIDGNAEIGEALGGKAVTLAFTSDSEAGGSGGCNSFGARYEADPARGSIAFSEIVSTLMACLDEGVGDVEAVYFEALNMADRYQIEGDRLTITGGGHTMLFARTPAGS